MGLVGRDALPIPSPLSSSVIVLRNDENFLHWGIYPFVDPVQNIKTELAALSSDLHSGRLSGGTIRSHLAAQARSFSGFLKTLRTRSFGTCQDPIQVPLIQKNPCRSFNRIPLTSAPGKRADLHDVKQIGYVTKPDDPFVPVIHSNEPTFRSSMEKYLGQRKIARREAAFKPLVITDAQMATYQVKQDYFHAKYVGKELLIMPNDTIIPEGGHEEWKRTVDLVRLWIERHPEPLVYGKGHSLEPLQSESKLTKSGSDVYLEGEAVTCFEWSSKCVQNALYGLFGRQFASRTHIHQRHLASFSDMTRRFHAWFAAELEKDILSHPPETYKPVEWIQGREWPADKISKYIRNVLE